MNREIKFRAWCKLDDTMLQNDYFVMDNGAGWGDELCIPIKSKDYILMQYTGLKDKNGKEIYEGDILYDDGFTAPIEWDMKDGISWGAFTDVQNAEIIGNIYENPELLTKKYEIT